MHREKEGWIMKEACSKRCELKTALAMYIIGIAYLILIDDTHVVYLGYMSACREEGHGSKSRERTRICM